MRRKLLFLAIALSSVTASASDGVSLAGGLILSTDKVEEVATAHVALSLGPQLNQFTLQGTYRANFRSWFWANTGVPLEFQGSCNSSVCPPEEVVKTAIKDIALEVGPFTLGCTPEKWRPSSKASVFTTVCEFGFPAFLSWFFEMRLKSQSNIGMDRESKTPAVAIDLFPRTAEIANARFEFDPGPWRETLFTGHAPVLKISQEEFLKRWGAPNDKLLREWTSLAPGAQTRLKIHTVSSEDVKRKLALSEESKEEEDTSRKVDQKAGKRLMVAPWPVVDPMEGGIPAGEVAEVNPQSCPSTETSERKFDIDAVSREPFAHAPSENLVEQCFGGCPRSWYVRVPGPSEKPNDTEIHFVGIYSSRGKTVDVRVLKSTKPIKLFLVSYEPVKWRVLAGPEARIHSVHYGGYDGSRSQVVGDVDPKSVQLIRHKLVLTKWERENSPEDAYTVRYLSSLRSASGGLETSFQGGSANQFFVVPHYRSHPEMVDRERKFLEANFAGGELRPRVLLHVPSGTGFGRYDVQSGKLEPLTLNAKLSELLEPFAVHPETGDVYLLTRNGIRNMTTGIEAQLSNDVPPFNYMTAMDFDSKRDRFLIVGRNAGYYSTKQYFWAFYPKNKSWKILGARDGELIGSLAYDPVNDLFYATNPDHNTEEAQLLWTMSPELEMKQALVLKEREKGALGPKKLYWTKDGLIHVSFNGRRLNNVITAVRSIDSCKGKFWDLKK